MSSWYEKEDEQNEVTRDATRWLWGGVALLVVAMAAGLLMMPEQEPLISQVRARHILFRLDSADPGERQRQLELAQQVREQLVGGASFASLAEKYSGDPGSRARGGDLGWAERGTYTDAFEAAVWTLPIGDLSDIVSTKFGFHIIEVTDREIAAAERYNEEIERKALQGDVPLPDTGDE